jgi:hypothetical protein
MGRFDLSKTGRSGGGERHPEILLRNMPARLDDQELGTHFEGVGNFTEEPGLVGHFVRHVQHRAEIDRRRQIGDSETIRTGLANLDPIRQRMSTAITRPSGPTIRANGNVKNPIAHPGSNTTIPSFTNGPKIFFGFSTSLRSGLNSRRPTQGGQT